MGEKIAVIGGSGFIGRAIQGKVIEGGMENSFVFTFNEHPENISNGLEKIPLNLLDEDSYHNICKHISTAIYVAGNSDHGIAKKNPVIDLELNVKLFLNFMKYFRGTLVLFSSQAVYYGLKGQIQENVEHISTIPYGISKQMVEVYSKYFLQINHISKLWIFRLMYGYGRGEKEKRLIPRCAKASYTKEKVVIPGNGKSFLNPLPSDFIATILLNSVQSLQEEPSNFLEITNLNHIDRINVADVVKFLKKLKHFNYDIIESGEDWPVEFWGNTENLSNHFKKWKIEFPNVWENLKMYFLELIANKGEE